MHHPYLRFLVTLMADYRRRMAGYKGLKDPYSNVLLFVSFFPALNAYALFNHVIFPDARHCAACTADVRGVYGFLMWAGFFMVNALLLMTETPVRPLPQTCMARWKKYCKLYAVLSIALALV